MRSTLFAAVALVIALGLFAPSASASAVIELTDKTFHDRVSDNSKAWFVEFFAPWCGHCKKLAPIWEDLAKELGSHINVAKVDCTANNEVCRKFDVKGYPTIKLFKSGPTPEAAMKYGGGRTVGEFKNYLNLMKALAPPKIVLRYFETRGRAEVLRLALEEARLPYTQELHNSDTWPAIKQAGIESGLLPFGQVPSLSVDDDHLVQTYAILRYIGRFATSLYPTEIRSAAKIDIVIEAVEDIRRKYGQLVYDPDFANKKTAYVTEFMPKAFRDLNNYVTSVAGNGPFVLGHMVSIADLAIFDLLTAHVALHPTLLSEQPRLEILYKTVENRPSIAAYLKSDRRPKYQNGKSAFFDNEQFPATA